MSNMTDNVERMFGRVETYAYAFARGGTKAFADLALDLLNTTTIDESVDETMPRTLYVRTWERGATIAREAGAPMKAQDDKSRNSQVSKLANFYTLGVVARDNDAVTEAMAHAARSTYAYTPLVKAAVACKAVLLKNRDADAATLIGAIDEALKAKPAEPASVIVARIAKSWDAIVHGAGEEPSPHADMFAALLASEPAGHAEGISQRFARIVAVLERIEADAKALPAITR